MTASGGINQQRHEYRVREKLYQTEATEMDSLLLEIKGRSNGKDINCYNKSQDNERRGKDNQPVSGLKEIGYAQKQSEEDDSDENKPEDMIPQLFIGIPYRLHIFKQIRN